MRRGLFVGRFQPFHNGHLEAVKSILGECQECVIAIGSSQKSHEPDNLFTLGERIEMIYESLKAEGLSHKAIIVGIPDVNNNSLWVSHLRALSPSFDVVYSNNPLVKRLFSEAGVKVRQLKLVRRGEYDGTAIRKSMGKDKEWEKHVPKRAKELMISMGAVERIAEISEGDKL